MTDVILRPWQPDDKPQLKGLWKLAFGDPDEYIDAFFGRFLIPGGCVVAETDGKVVSAMYIIGGQTAYPYRSNTLSAGYTYALATLPEYRGRGIGSAVYKAATDAALQTADAACVLPAETGLYPFYEKASGAKPLSYVRETRLKKTDLAGISAVNAARIPALHYAGMREWLMGGMPHVTFDDAVFDFMEETGTDFFVLENGVAAADTSDGLCRITELLVSNGDFSGAIAGVARWCSAQDYIVRSPAFMDGPGEIRPFVLSVLRKAPDYSLPNDLWWGFGMD